jgi:hypothetical protein
MPALNHIIIKALPRILDTWFRSTWFSTGSGQTKSFKESFQGSVLRLGNINKAESDKNVNMTATVEVSSFIDEPPIYYGKNLATPKNFSRRSPTRPIYVGEPHEDPIYSPGWLGEQSCQNGDLESNYPSMPNCLGSFSFELNPSNQNSEVMMINENTRTTTPPHDSIENIHSKSWLSLN